jgi:hypothetical protein
MPTAPIVLGLIALTLGISLLALWKGGPAERLGGAVVGANVVLSIAGGLVLPQSAQSIARLTLDGLTALCLLVIAVRYASFWLGGVMLLYAAQFSLHAFYIVTSRPIDLLHIKINNVNFLLISICLAVGTGVAWWQRTRAAGAATKSPATPPKS